ncbi:MAG: hypothetical protein PHI50_03685 [Alphaproteobacteria bacterium]|nr:hypothetical protein [Alphaproteobacteria bacterium]
MAEVKGKWDGKFGSSKKEVESPNLIAQRLINIFRQLHILNEEAIERYNQMLLSTPEEAIECLPSMPSGSEVREYLDFLRQKQNKGGESLSEEDFAKVEEKQKALRQAEVKKRLEKEEELAQKQGNSGSAQEEEEEDEKPSSQKQTGTPSALVERQPFGQEKTSLEEVKKQASDISPQMAQQLIATMIELQQKSAKNQADIIAKALGQTQENLVHLMASTVSELKENKEDKKEPQKLTGQSPLLENLAAAIKDTQEKTNQTLLQILDKTQKNKESFQKDEKREHFNESQEEKKSDLLKSLISAMAETQMKAAENQAKVIAEALSEAQEKQKNMMEEQSFKLVREQAKVLAQAHHDAQELARQQLDVLSRNLIDSQEKLAQQAPNQRDWMAPKESFSSSQILSNSMNQEPLGLDYNNFSQDQNASTYQDMTPDSYQNVWNEEGQEQGQEQPYYEGEYPNEVETLPEDEILEDNPDYYSPEYVSDQDAVYNPEQSSYEGDYPEEESYLDESENKSEEEQPLEESSPSYEENPSSFEEETSEDAYEETQGFSNKPLEEETSEEEIEEQEPVYEKEVLSSPKRKEVKDSKVSESYIVLDDEKEIDPYAQVPSLKKTRKS